MLVTLAIIMPRLQSPDVYKDLEGTSPSASHAQRVLQTSIEEKNSVIDDHEAKLQAEGTDEKTKLGSGAVKSRIPRIVEELKTEVKHQALFCRATNAGKEMTDVDKAILVLVRFIQNGWRVRGRHGTFARRPTATTASITPIAPPPNTVAMPSVSTPAQTPAPSPQPTQRVIVSYRSDTENPYPSRLADAISTVFTDPQNTSSRPSLAVFKANAENRFKDYRLDWSRLTVDIAGFAITCKEEYTFSMACEMNSKAIVLRGLECVAFKAEDTSKPTGTSSECLIL